MAPRLREVIASVPEVRGVMSQVGRPDDGTDVTSFFNLEFNVPLEADGSNGARAMTPASRRSRTELDDRESSGRASAGIPGSTSASRSSSATTSTRPSRASRGPTRSSSSAPTSTRSRRPASGSPTSCGRVPRHRERRRLPHRRPAQPGDPDRPRGLRPLRRQRRRRRGGRPGGDRRPRRSRRWSRGRSSTTSSCGCPRTSATTQTTSPASPVDVPGAEGKPGARIPLSHLAKIDPAQAGCVVHLPREQPPLSSRSSSASRAATSPRRSPRPRRKVKDPETGAKLPAGLPHRVVRRVRPDAGGQRPADVDGAALDRPDHGPALHGVQLDEGRPAGHGQRRCRRRWAASGP